MGKAIVVIPVHNHARWVWGAVESVARQDHKDKAVVVVDDGSADGSHRSVVDNLTWVSKATTGNGEGTWHGTGPGDMPVTVIRFTKASGPSFARNRGIEESLGQEAQFIGFLDSDDEYAPTKLSRSIEEIERYPGLVGAAYSDYETVSPEGRRIREFKPPYSRELLLRECIVNCDSVVSREAIEKVGGFDEELRVAEDYDWWLRLSEHYSIAHIPEALVTIRVGGHSSTANVRGEVWQACHRRLREKLHQRAQGGR